MIRKEIDRTHRIIKTTVATATILFFYFAEAAVAYLFDLKGVANALIRGSIVWLLVILTSAYCLIRYGSLSSVGIRKSERGTPGKVLFYIPFILAAVASFAGGFSEWEGVGLIFSELFLSLGIGFSSEMYFRGILVSLWRESGAKKSILISSLVFAGCHILNAFGADDPTEAILYVIFAFVYGAATSIEYIIGGSIFPCIVLHAFHDFCSFVSNRAGGWVDIAIDSFQIVILLLFLIYCTKHNSSHIKNRISII